MLDSISRISLRFRDKTLEQRYTQHSDRNRALFIKYIYTFLMGMLAVIFFYNFLLASGNKNIIVRICMHIATLALLRLSACCYP